jgi:hypothetical protein
MKESESSDDDFMSDKFLAKAAELDQRLRKEKVEQ